MANDIISLVDPQTATDEAVQLLGQAYAYRAMFYLDLARLYEPKANGYTDISSIQGLTVPIVTEATTEHQAKNNPRATREVLYDFILSDLAMAQAYLSPSANTYTLPTVAAVYGLGQELCGQDGLRGAAARHRLLPGSRHGYGQAAHLLLRGAHLSEPAEARRAGHEVLCKGLDRGRSLR